MWVWNGWQALSSRRQYTENGAQPIQLSEILAYLQLTSVTSQGDRDDFLYLITTLDRRWLEDIQKKRLAEQRKAQAKQAATRPTRPPRRR